MSQVANRYTELPEPFHTLYALIAPELEESETILRQELRSDDAHVDEMIRYGCLLGGKTPSTCPVVTLGKGNGDMYQRTCDAGGCCGNGSHGHTHPR